MVKTFKCEHVENKTSFKTYFITKEGKKEHKILIENSPESDYFREKYKRLGFKEIIL